MLSFSVIVPTRNAGSLWRDWLEAFAVQSIKPASSIIIDSTSNDNTVLEAQNYDFSITIISKDDFNHGGTRNYAVRQFCREDIIVFLTQDAILSDINSLSSLLLAFKDPDVAAVCGRQIPHYDANPLAIHARCFNYPCDNIIKSLSDVSILGLKVAFMSNSFSAYRRDVFEKLGGFPENTILAEDMYMASKMILAGYKVAYCAKAAVMHSHNYTPWEEFRRYFDIGVFHACEPWIQEELGGASGEGLRFVKSELNYLWHNAPLWIPRSLLTTVCKLLGYNLGKNHKRLPMSWRPKLSMYKSYWLQQK
ncbi:glycosyltransferase family 2 protein [Aeromonas jandaei]|uniref:glycosyltransferase family 2 protein n=1 Tax=Aeromonas jandaei TaxID=650 RepID=UPI00366D4927